MCSHGLVHDSLNPYCGIYIAEGPFSSIVGLRHDSLNPHCGIYLTEGPFSSIMGLRHDSLNPYCGIYLTEPFSSIMGSVPTQKREEFGFLLIYSGNSGPES